MVSLKISAFNGALGVILPKEVLADLKAREGDMLVVSAAPGGIRLTAYAPKVVEQVEIGREIAQKYRNTLRALAK